MPLDPHTGVFYALHGPADGVPLLVTLPLMASFTEIFGPELAPVQDGYLGALADRYRVLLVDYPSIGGSRDIAPSELTADRVCADLLGVASAAGFDRFAYAGYSWGAAVGLQLAHRTDRLTALALGGWPPLGGPYAQILAAARRKLPNPEPSSLKILRSAAQYAQWLTYYESMLDWPEAESVAAIRIPRLIYFGAEGDLVEAGLAVPIASLIRSHRDALQAQGWQVAEIGGEGHGVTMKPALVMPVLRGFLDAVLP